MVHEIAPGFLGPLHLFRRPESKPFTPSSGSRASSILASVRPACESRPAFTCGFPTSTDTSTDTVGADLYRLSLTTYPSNAGRGEPVLSIAEATSGNPTLDLYVAEARHDQAEALYQALLREGYEQADNTDHPLLADLDELPRDEALRRLTGQLGEGHPSPVPHDLATALSYSIRRLDPDTFGPTA